MDCRGAVVQYSQCQIGRVIERKEVVTIGYYIDLTAAEWEITESPEALAAVREMPTKYHAIKRGGSSNGEKWFSWISNDEIENAESVEKVFNMLGFETAKTDNGFQLTAYNSKHGQEDLFLAVMAPYSADGSYIEWRGEDGELWKHEVKNGRMYCSDAKIVFTNERPYTYWHYDMVAGVGHELNIDIYAPTLAEKLATAQKWDDENEKYFAQRRAEIEEEKKAQAEA